MIDIGDIGAVEARLAQLDPTSGDDASAFSLVLDGFDPATSDATIGGAIPSGEVAVAPPQIASLIEQSAARYGVDPALVKAVVNQESGFDQFATSNVGAQGLMQLMPETAASLGVTDSYDAAQNIDGGTRYLRQLLDRFGGDARRAVAAYNAGPGAVERYDGVPPYAETQKYVSAVLGGYARYSASA
jgi:soluble lytic murein transglycosylase-like protein